VDTLIAGPGPERLDDGLAVGEPDDVELDEELAGDDLGGEELAELALADDPVDEVPADAIPFDIYAHGAGAPSDFLPRWYMPPVMMRRATRWQRWVIVAVVLGFLTVDLFGLCITYGLLTAA
jgi:hypothetical protein